MIKSQGPDLGITAKNHLRNQIWN